MITRVGKFTVRVKRFLHRADSRVSRASRASRHPTAATPVPAYCPVSQSVRFMLRARIAVSVLFLFVDL